jgi:cell fate (sporulation/competence/biofilm development) regulator YlbF (YheA/YmcA/DUF963 family)
MTDKLLNALGELANELREDPTVKKYNDAKDKYIRDEEAHALIREYNVQHILKQEEEKKTEPDQKAIADLEARLSQLMEQIQNLPSMKEMKEAEIELDSILSTINEVITASISPAGGCSGSCSTCGGCS